MANGPWPACAGWSKCKVSENITWVATLHQVSIEIIVLWIYCLDNRVDNFRFSAEFFTSTLLTNGGVGGGGVAV